MFVKVRHSIAGDITVVNFPLKLSESPGGVKTAAPTLGQHNREILIELLGITEEEFQQLRRKGVISYN
jgi:crotonobetainyl-CoA:carnitine CoA-transferase CaiB-like acyl-CoA transferase